jgi:hypothetical protein
MGSSGSFACFSFLSPPFYKKSADFIMPLEKKQVALIAAGVAVTAGVGYLVYFDHKRRNDPSFRKQLSK